MTPGGGARGFQPSVLLRVVAFAIAIGGLLDPAIAVSGASRPRVAVVALDPASPAAIGVRDGLARTLGAAYEIVPQLVSDAAAAIVIGDRYPAAVEAAGFRAGLPDALAVATVTIATPAASGAHLIRVDAPREIPAATIIHLGVEIEGAALTGHTTEVSAIIAGLEAGRASHTWTAGETRWRGGIDAVPIGEPPYVVQVRLKPDTTETTAPAPVVSGFSRTVSDVVVDVRPAPIRVQFYEPRPSWATTFLRRALEADARFQVAALSFTSRGVSTQAGGAVALEDRRLDQFDVIVAGGVDRLSPADLRGLDRFMRERGGAVVVVPDQRIDAFAVHDFVFGRVRLQPDRASALEERLLEQPAKLVVVPPAASLQVSELLVARVPPLGAEVIARVAGETHEAVIVAMPRGDGRLVLSGAMDAWRFRAADDGAFDRFWQSTIAGLALAAPPPIGVDVEPSLLRPGERARIVARVRPREDTAVSASVDGEPVRLLPDPEAGVYRGSFVAGNTPGRSTVEVRADVPMSPGAKGPGLRGSRTVLVRTDLQRVSPAGPALSMLASSHRGIDVSPDHLEDLTPFLSAAVAAPRATHVLQPMRSAWWILPFAACLSAEWWLRRRRGLR